MAIRAEALPASEWPNRTEEEGAPMPARRWTDASKLSFPLQLVITIVGSLLAAAIGVWSAQSRLELQQSELSSRIEKTQIQVASDVKNILTQMEADKRVAEANAKLREANDAQMKAAIDNLTRELRMTQVTVQQLQEKVITGRR